MENDRTVLVNFGDDMSLDEAYRELGKAYYEGGFEDPLPQLLPLFDKITRLRSGGEEASFSEEPAPAASDSGEQEAEIPVPQEESPAFCPNCGAQLEDDSVFCGNCGFKVR